MWDILLCALGWSWEWLLWVFWVEDRREARVVLLGCGLFVLAATLAWAYFVL